MLTTHDTGLDAATSNQFDNSFKVGGANAQYFTRP